MDRHRPSLTRLAVAAVPLLFLGYLFVYPVGTLLAVTVSEEAWRSLGSSRIAGVATFTLWQATASTVLTVAAALPLTAVVARYRFPGREAVRAATLAPFVLPTVVVASAFLALGTERGVGAIVAAHVFYNIGLVVRTVGGMWSRIDPRLVDAARTLGASPMRAFREVVLPLLRPALAGAASLVFLLSFTSFGIVLILGGLRYRTVEVEIYQRALTSVDIPAAAALSAAQLVAVTLLLSAAGRLQTSARIPLVPESETLRRPRTVAARAGVLAASVVTVAALAVPPAVLVARSLRDGAAGWRFLADPGRLALHPGEALVNSLTYAAAAAAVATVVGLAAARLLTTASPRAGRIFDTTLMLPLGTSAVTVGLGFLVALDRPVDLRTSPVLVPLAHALVAVPFVVRAVLPTLRAIRPELREAAAVLGASPGRVWREVDRPIVARAAVVGAGLAAAVSLGEFGATSVIVRPDTTTVPTLIFRLLGRPGAVTYGAAMALAVILMVVCGGLMVLVDRLRLGSRDSF